ncbi:MAG TPA: hypothetical protein DIU09_06400 [Hyphomonadaceae bacterium]|nr:hypothetical protein AEM38_01315 [Hyphomonadaceae bacterium UKL13-1]HCP64201.1 hypothetical protein [Hyphomonadaceae bacterium]
MNIYGLFWKPCTTYEARIEAGRQVLKKFGGRCDSPFFAPLFLNQRPKEGTTEPLESRLTDRIDQVCPPIQR